jgi:hypothetical protein
VIIELGVCQDQSREINELPGGRGFGEGQVWTEPSLDNFRFDDITSQRPTRRTAEAPMKIRAATRMIRPMYMLVLVLVAATLTLGAGEASAQVAIDAPTIYRLNPASSFQRGCFPPCLCPIGLGEGVRGTLVLAASGFDGLFNNYTVTDVNWTVTLGDQELRVTGSGTYKVGGEFAVQQQLGLDLKVGDDPVQHFDSGLVPGGGQLSL